MHAHSDTSLGSRAFNGALAHDEQYQLPPPHNLDVEQALLGALLVHNPALSQVSSTVGPEHFFDALHGEIFRAISALVGEGKCATAMTLAPHFATSEPVNSTTTVAQYLGWLTANASTYANARDYAVTIRNLALRRQLHIIGEDMTRAASYGEIDFPLGEQIAEAVTRLKTLEPGRQLSMISAGSFAGQPIPPRPWHAPELVPAQDATMLGGDGGTGKSILAAQLAVATVLGRSWLGVSAKRGPVIYLGAEDDLPEMHRRLAAIARHQEVDFERLADLHICSLAGKDAILATEDDTGIIRPTALWHQFGHLVDEVRPVLIVYDTLADLFGGNENSRTQARQFVGMLRGLAIETKSTALLLAHPSLTGLSSGSGTSGSTAWSNSVRARLYLERVKEGQREPDPNARVLRTMKANYGPTGGEIRLRWHEGVFMLESDAVAGLAGVSARQAHEENIFLTLVADYASKGRHVGMTTGSSYAPTIFAQDERAQTVGKLALRDAMNRLFARGTIRLGAYGPPSRRCKCLEVVQ